MIQRLFRLKQNRTDVKTEVMPGITTFMTLSCIIFVQPTVLSACGMDFGAVIVATCVASAAATFLMGFYANYPIALAPGMGQNFFLAYTDCLWVFLNGERKTGNGEPLFVHENLAERKDEAGRNRLPVFAGRADAR